MRGGTIGHVGYLTVRGRRGEAVRPLVTDRRGIERRWIDFQAVFDDAAKVIAGAETVTVKAIEATTMMEWKWEDPAATQGIGQD